MHARLRMRLLRVPPERPRPPGGAVRLGPEHLHATPFTVRPAPPSPPSAAPATELVDGAQESPKRALAATSAAIGVAAGLFGALLGVGGGMIAIPLLTWAARLSQHEAHGTSLVAVVATSLVGCASFAGRGQLAWPAAASIAATASLTSILGARVMSSLSPTTLKRLLGVYMMAVAPLVPLKAHLATLAAAGSGTSGSVTLEGAGPDEGVPTTTLLWCACVGTASGALSGMFGVGGGTLVTPALALLTELPHTAVLGTTLASMVLPSALGAHTHWRLGNVAARVLPGLLGGTAVGAFSGAQLALVAPQGVLRWLFCATFLALGAKGASGR